MVKKKIKIKAKKQVNSTSKVEKKELTRLGSLLRTLGTIGGTAAGGFIGQSAAGGSIGNSLGASLSKWLGSGEYAVKSNTLVKGSQSIPSMHSTSTSVVVRHKEFIGTITGSVNFTLNSEFPINPGLAVTFPWLSRVAACYQQYKIRGMVFHYVPTSGSAVSSTNPALGAVMLQTSYRSNDSQPSSKAEMLNEYYACESVPCEAFCHPIECSPTENPFQIHYVRNTAVPDQDSPLMYDIGMVYVATAGMPAANVVGDLWCSYEIELLKPVVVSNVSSLFSTSLYSDDVIITAVSTTNLFGTGTIDYDGGNLPITYAANGVITIPSAQAGIYVIVVSWIASTVFTVVDMTAKAIAYTNCVANQVQYGAAFTGQSITGVGSQTERTYIVAGIEVTNLNTASVAITGIAITGAFDSANVSVYYLGPPY